MNDNVTDMQYINIARFMILITVYMHHHSLWKGPL